MKVPNAASEPFQISHCNIWLNPLMVEILNVKMIITIIAIGIAHKINFV